MAFDYLPNINKKTISTDYIVTKAALQSTIPETELSPIKDRRVLIEADNTISITKADHSYMYNNNYSYSVSKMDKKIPGALEFASTKISTLNATNFN